RFGSGLRRRVIVGRRTRAHSDLDVVVQTGQLDEVWELLGRLGFVHTPADDDRPWNFVVTDAGGRRVDVHVVTFAGNGDALYGPPGTRAVGWPAGALDGAGTVAGRPVRCAVAAQQIRSRSGYELRESDHHDLALLRSLDPGS
ncbi:MAG: nucleotidyltransferase domain-containing protein, partial [Microthrixaceae bacterium]